jgi:hypothetical protein
MATVSEEREKQIDSILREYPQFEKKDIRRIFNYLENYCKITNDKATFESEFLTSYKPCSGWVLRNKIMNLIRTKFTTFRTMNSVDILKFVFGEKAVEDSLQKYAKEHPEDDAEEDYDGHWSMESRPENQELLSSMEEVDGGSQKVVKKRRRQRKTKKTRTKKMRKNKKNKSSKK